MKSDSKASERLARHDLFALGVFGAVIGYSGVDRRSLLKRAPLQSR